MQHTALTTRNFVGLATTSMLLGVFTAGFGFVDLAMVASFGAAHVAAVGLGELIAAAAFSVLFGYSDMFTTRLAQAEGSGGTRVAFATPVALFLLSAFVVSAIFMLAGLALPFMLAASGRGESPGWPVAAYVTIRFSTAFFVLLSLAAVEALKICGAKSLALLAVVVGFLLNILGNATFLYTPLLNSFWNVEAAVATATALAQALMGLLALVIVYRERSRHHGKSQSINWRAVRAELPRFLVEGFSVGSRSLNDWISSTLPIFFIGAHMGNKITAATVVATRIATVFYRVPQACFNASLVLYSYALDDPRSDRGGKVGRLIVLSALPTAAAAALFLIVGWSIASLFVSVPANLTVHLLSAYFIFLPAYFLEHFYGELMVAHQRNLFLFRVSTAVTLVVVLPISYIAVYVVDSAFLAIASRGLAGIPLALTYWLTLRSNLRLAQA